MNIVSAPAVPVYVLVDASKTTFTGVPPDFKSPIRYVPFPSIIPGASSPKSADTLLDTDVIGERSVSSTVTSSSLTTGTSSFSTVTLITSNALARLSVKSTSVPFVFCSYATDSTVNSNVPVEPSGTLIPNPAKSATASSHTSSTAL